MLLKIEYPLKQKIQLVVNISNYTKAMNFKVWLEHYAGFHTYNPNGQTGQYEFTISCDDFTDCAKIETYLQSGF